MNNDKISKQENSVESGHSLLRSENEFNPLQEKIAYLEARIKTLGDICLEVNPYAEIPDELKMRLMDFNIVDLSDPFKITNTLLMLLEDTIDELHVIKPFDETTSEVKEIL